LQCAVTHSRIVPACRVVKQSKRSIGRVAGAGDVAKKRPSASGRILIGGVGEKRPSTNGRVEIAFCIAQKRIQTNRRVECAAVETQKGVLPFSSVASGIASVRWRTYGLRLLDERKADERKYD
jgi:hypothetical protein